MDKSDSEDEITRHEESSISDCSKSNYHLVKTTTIYLRSNTSHPPLSVILNGKPFKRPVNSSQTKLRGIRNKILFILAFPLVTLFSMGKWSLRKLKLSSLLVKVLLLILLLIGIWLFQSTLSYIGMENLWMNYTGRVANLDCSEVCKYVCSSNKDSSPSWTPTTT